MIQLIKIVEYLNYNREYNKRDEVILFDLLTLLRRHNEIFPSEHIDVTSGCRVDTSALPIFINNFL